MFGKLKDFLSSHETQAPRPDLRTAVGVLLIEAAQRDDHFDPAERAAIMRVLSAKFALSPDECAQLMAACEATVAKLVQLHPYTQAIFLNMSAEERIQVIEMLWEVAYADGVLDPEEDVLIRRVAGLIDVTDRDRVLARQRVLARKGHPPGK